MKSFEKLKNGFEKLFPSLWNLTKGTFLLVFWETPSDLFVTFKQHWNKSKTQIQKISTIIAGLIISIFILYGFYGLYKDFDNWRTKEWREDILFENYEIEIQKFFKKYNERFLAHDCAFMREVGADEAMFDKWGNTSYTDSYKCEEFVRFKKQYLIPISIDKIEKTGDKYRTKGKILIIKINQGESWKIRAVYFDLWKKLDWDLWHFNNPKNGPRIIPAEISSF